MFRNLKSEAILTFDIVTEGPLHIKSSENNSLDPRASDATFITTFKNGVEVPVIPGSGMKGVFRSRAERLYTDKVACNILEKACVNGNEERDFEGKKAKINFLPGKEKYRLSCPVCRLFGSKLLKSRIIFEDAAAEEGYTVGTRSYIAIDRVTGGQSNSALRNMDFIESGRFKGKIKLQNFERWQVRLLLALIDDMNEGFITLGGHAAKGFGKVRAEKLNLKLRYYGSKKVAKYEFNGYCNERTIEGYKSIKDELIGVNFINIREEVAIDESII